ncbi:hypothetical protein Asi03nite_71850 [Actinoplanes siamensis]|uniref:Uncharacterized protein n=1 Tax=Actinoplanes siamensis TaxID=1223317 RepID=A0A919NF27_9ACTN|nr:hypothetical protein Asi03nite_71850 [Actinoplanes siamensis]
MGDAMALAVPGMALAHRDGGRRRQSLGFTLVDLLTGMQATPAKEIGFVPVARSTGREDPWS